MSDNGVFTGLLRKSTHFGAVVAKPSASQFQQFSITFG
jgi:hypothetical protein